jgi:hypothetical protein
MIKITLYPLINEIFIQFKELCLFVHENKKRDLKYITLVPFFIKAIFSKIIVFRSKSNQVGKEPLLDIYNF